MDQSTLVSEYYRCLDEDDYGTLRSILNPEFVQHRPDRSFHGRDAFVEFMQNGRPKAETTHRVDSLLESTASLAAYGQLFEADGSKLLDFIDVFRFDDNGRILAVDTFS